MPNKHRSIKLSMCSSILWPSKFIFITFDMCVPYHSYFVFFFRCAWNLIINSLHLPLNMPYPHRFSQSPLTHFPSMFGFGFAYFPSNTHSSWFASIFCLQINVKYLFRWNWFVIEVCYINCVNIDHTVRYQHF